jgi:hypothetical protein
METVAEIIRSLERDHGRLLPADVVTAAADPESPLHDHFTWDDTAAAIRYRLFQARALIRTVKLEITVHEVPLSVVCYVRDPELDSKHSGYRNVMALRSEEDNARAAIVDEMKRVANAVRRAKTIAAVLGFVKEVNQIDELARSVSARATAQPPVEA